MIPIDTAIRAVPANHARVFQASRAAPATSRRLAIEATMARNTRAGTTALSRVTKVLPTTVSVSVNQLGSTSPLAVTESGPMDRATRPRRTPSTSPIRTWVPKEGRHDRRVRAADGVVVLMGVVPFAATGGDVDHRLGSEDVEVFSSDKARSGRVRGR